MLCINRFSFHNFYRQNELAHIGKYGFSSYKSKSVFRWFSTMSIMQKRGALIVLEGCDRAGKTTQCKRIVETLISSGHKAKFMNFPDRTTQCGALINAYLTNNDNFTDEGIHLLFTLNRWEAKNEMERLLRSGVSLVVDRYSFSGVAFSSAKGLSIDWCKAPETGLLKPDLVLLLTLSAEAMAKRGGFGEERYEVPAFQQKVMEKFQALKDDNYWKMVDADKSEDSLTVELSEMVVDAIHSCSDKPLGMLW